MLSTKKEYGLLCIDCTMLLIDDTLITTNDRHRLRNYLLIYLDDRVTSIDHPVISSDCLFYRHSNFLLTLHEEVKSEDIQKKRKDQHIE